VLPSVVTSFCLQIEIVHQHTLDRFTTIDPFKLCDRGVAWLLSFVSVGKLHDRAHLPHLTLQAHKLPPLMELSIRVFCRLVRRMATNQSDWGGLPTVGSD